MGIENRQKLLIFIIDDDEVVLELYSRLLKKAGYDVSCFTSAQNVLSKIVELQPDCVLCDLLLPGVDGLELFQEIRQNEDIRQPVFIVITGKQFEYDKRRSLEQGIDGYFTKPVNAASFVDEISEIIHSRVIVEFWGCRGTLPVPGSKSVRYGGNTNCVSLRLANKHFFIFDAGTGIRELSNHLLLENKFPLSAKIFISHPHYDHINGLPFFSPLYMQGNKFEILGSNHNGYTLEQAISGQMDSIYFPVTMKEFSANTSFRTLSEETFTIDDIKVTTILLNHPGRCLGYRIEFKGKSFCYVTDHELYLEDSSHYNQFEVDRLINFIKETNLLIIDTTYHDEEYKKKVGWGHSCVSRVIDVANKAKVQLLCLHHHDPGQTDEDIDLKLKKALALLKARQSKTRCIIAHEGDRIVL